MWLLLIAAAVDDAVRSNCVSGGALFALNVTGKSSDASCGLQLIIPDLTWPNSRGPTAFEAAITSEKTATEFNVMHRLAAVLAQLGA